MFVAMQAKLASLHGDAKPAVAKLVFAVLT